MDGKKTYSIVINGVEESVKAVEALNSQLDALEKRINALQSKVINVSGGSAKGGSGVASKELSVQEEIDKKILDIENKLSQVRDENYKKLLHMKEELKEYTQIAKSQVAAEANKQGLFDTSTMLGMKEQLKSIKAEMQTLDVDSERFKDLTRQAGELNQKLKEIEQSYGQFGRNVGNYAQSMAEGFDKIKVAVGDTIREYGTYREAVKALKNERFQLSQTLGTEAEEYKKIDVALKQLESDYADLNKSSRFMDNMLDTMTSFSALAGLGMGIQTLFGIDDKDFNETMKKLTSLLIILKSIETLSLQAQKKEGWLGKAFGLTGGAFDKVANDYKKATASLLNFVKAGKLVPGVMKGITVAFKAFKAVFTGFALLALPEIVNAINDIIKQLNTSKVKAEQATAELKTFNKVMEERKNLLMGDYLKGNLKDEEYLDKLYNLETKSLIRQIDLLRQRGEALQNTFVKGKTPFNFFSSTKNTEFSGQKFTGETTVGAGRLKSISNGLPIIGEGIEKNDFEYTVKSITEVEDAWRKCNEAVKEGKDYFDKWGHGFSDWVGSIFTSVKDTEKIMKGMGNIRLSDFIAEFQEINQQFNDGRIKADQYAKDLQRLTNVMNNHDIITSVIANLDKYIPDEEVRNAVQGIINEIYRLNDAFNMTSPQQIHYWNQVRIDAMKDGLQKDMAQIAESERYEIEQYAHTEEQVTLLHNKYERERQNAREREAKKNKKSAKKNGKSIQDIENELMKLRTENMKAGLEKNLKMIEDERTIALQKTKEYGKKAAEYEALINQKFDKKILDEKRRWAFEIIKVYEDLYARIESINRATFQTEAETASKNVSMRADKNKLDTGFSMITPTKYDDSKNLEEYYRKVIEIEKKASETLAEIEQERLDRELEYDKAEEKRRYEMLINTDNGEYVQQLREGLITQEQYDDLLEREKDAHNARMNALDKAYSAATKENTENTLKEQREIYNDFYGKIINDVESDKQKIDEIMARQPVVDKAGWGIVNMKATSFNYDKALEDYDNLKTRIINKQEELRNDLREHRISPEDFAMRQKELDSEIKAIDESVKQVMMNQRELIGFFIQSIQMYIQEGLQAVQTVMDALADYQDYQFDKEEEMLNRQNELIENKLNEQEQIIEKYKDKVDSIEDELSTARGDRRQHLIDQLNAEIAAQRKAQKEKERLQKQQEALEKKQEKLDKERKKAEYKRNLMNIIISTAMATANGLATQPFVPVGIAMGALATSLGMVQYALAAKQKPYAAGGQLDGGVAVGNRHRDGGIKVLGGRAEIEGGEYITNRLTTAKNIDLLSYINSKKKRIDISDMIEFYNSGKVRTSIKRVRSKFEDGGYIPTLPASLDISDQLQNIVINQDNRPIVVSVVDINNKQEDVRRVQTLAGL